MLQMAVGRHSARVIGAIALLLAASAAWSVRALEVQVLRSTGGLAPEVVGLFREPAACQTLADGSYLVFDRAGHRVYRVPPSGSEAVEIVRIGAEAGNIIGPSAFALAGDRFIVADAPRQRERVQLFGFDGGLLSSFSLPGRATARITQGRLTLNGVSSLRWTGRSIVMSQPETGGVMTEFTPRGHPVRTIGQLRATGHEDDRDLHLALNSGLPLADPTGGFYFVFHAGLPLFRKYDDDGRLLFERHIQGPELDATVQTLPTTWPRRTDGLGRDLPIVPPTVRAAEVDPAGNLWVSLWLPFTYVYDSHGDKIRTVQFRGAGLVSPDSLFFESRDRLLVTPGCYRFSV
jgi:hypothetical protein